MSRTIKLSIRARGETDSPTVDDLLDQIRDYFDILAGVEEALAEDGKKEIEWRVIKATTNSPIAIEVAPFPIEHAMNIDNRVELVTRSTAMGLNQLQTKGERPTYFNDKVLTKAKSVFQRVTNGLDETKIEYGPGIPKMDVTPVKARKAVENVQAVLEPKVKPHKESGSLEGYADSITRDNKGRPILMLCNRLNGQIVKCFVSGEAVTELEKHRIKDVWHRRRVTVQGMLHFKGFDTITHADVEAIRFMPDEKSLPDIDDILDENFTGGLGTEEYLNRLRDAKSN